MEHNRIYKAADSLPAFLGVDGKAINHFIIAGFVCFTMLMALIAAGVHMLIVAPVFLIVISSVFAVIKLDHKKGGILAAKLRAHRQSIVYSNDGNIFKNLVQKGE